MTKLQHNSTLKIAVGLITLSTSLALAQVPPKSAARHTPKAAMAPHTGRTPAATPHVDLSQPSDQAQTRAWLQDAASRVPPSDAATRLRESHEADQMQRHSRPVPAQPIPQSQNEPEPTLTQTGQI